MKKRHRFSLFLAILLPVMTAIVLGEGGIYLGAYFTLREAAVQNIIDDDNQTISTLNARLSENNYWDTYLLRVIRKYKEIAPETLPKDGTPEQKEYQQAMANVATGWIGNSISQVLRTYSEGFLAVLMDDTEKNRMVVIANSDELGWDDEKGSLIIDSPLYVGAFFDKTALYEEGDFYGIPNSYPKIGDVFESGVHLTDFTDTTNPDLAYPIWILSQRTAETVFTVIPIFSTRFAIIASGVLVLLMATTFLILLFAVLRPAKALSSKGNDYTASLKEGRNEEIFKLSTGRVTNEMTDLNDAFFYMQQAIDEYTFKVRDLAMAKRIQSSMVPSEALVGKNFLIRGSMRPAKEVGGDLYNYFMIDDDHVAFVIGDVSGKGASAALFMAKSNTIFRVTARHFDIDGANRLLCEGNGELLFVTAFLAVLELSTGKLRYVNAGHEPVFIYHDGEYKALPEESNFMLGYADDMHFVVQEMTLSLGDRLFLYTDGVSEAMNIKGDLFGKDRIINTLNEAKNLSGIDVFPVMMHAMADFVGEAEQSDDAAMVAVDYVSEKSLAFTPDKEGLAGVAPFVDEALEGKPIGLISEIQVILDELCTNVVLYSGATEKANLTLRDDGKSITGIITDNGKAFNPLKDVPKHDENTPGGLGIITAINMSNSLDYERIHGRNVVIFVKNYEE